jgi:hypothetical protein
MQSAELGVEVGDAIVAIAGEDVRGIGIVHIGQRLKTLRKKGKPFTVQLSRTQKVAKKTDEAIDLNSFDSTNRSTSTGSNKTTGYKQLQALSILSNEVKLNKDYGQLVVEANMQQNYRYYRDRLTPNVNTISRITCVICHRNTCKHVFFPCTHCCVCPECIKEHSLKDPPDQIRMTKSNVSAVAAAVAAANCGGGTSNDFGSSSEPITCPLCADWSKESLRSAMELHVVIATSSSSIGTGASR